jgi:hypothetical protein
MGMEDTTQTNIVPHLKPALKAGQTWINASGQEISISCRDDRDYPFVGFLKGKNRMMLYTSDGIRYGEERNGPSYLVKLNRYDWHNIRSRYNWAATDSNGEQIACTTRPVDKFVDRFIDQSGKTAWWAREHLDYVVISPDKITPCADWCESVEQRPKQFEPPQDCIDVTKPVRLKRNNSRSTYYVVGPHRSHEGSVVLEMIDDGRLSSSPVSEIENVPLSELPVSITIHVCKDAVDGERYLSLNPPTDAIILHTSTHTFTDDEGWVVE